MFILVLKFLKKDIRLKISMDACSTSLQTTPSKRQGLSFNRFRFGLHEFNTYFVIFFHRSAFAPLYGNQYSGQQSNQYWPNSGSHYGSSGNAGMSSLLKHDSDDLDGPLHNINRKEKRQYKKRKHKNQREKQPSGMCYL